MSEARRGRTRQAEVREVQPGRLLHGKTLRPYLSRDTVLHKKAGGPR